VYTGNQLPQILSFPKTQTTPEQKTVAIRYLITRLTTYPLNDKDRDKEYNTIKHILHTNKFNLNILDTFIKKTKSTKKQNNNIRHSKPHTTLNQDEMGDIYICRKTY
jgi:hypothetical protein